MPNFTLDEPAFTTAMHLAMDLHSSGDDVGAAVDVDGAARDAAGVGAGEIGTGGADIVDVDQLMQRRLLGGVVQKPREILDSGRCASGKRARRDRMDAD